MVADGIIYELTPVLWNGVDEQKYELTIRKQDETLRERLKETAIRKRVEENALPRGMEQELEVVKQGLVETSEEWGMVNRRKREIRQYKLDTIEPKERYRLTNKANQSKEVVVAFGTERKEVLRKYKSFLRREGAQKLEWLGWEGLDVSTLSEQEMEKRQRKLKKKQYDIEYQKTHKDRIYLSVPKDFKAKLNIAAKEVGTDKTKYVMRCIEAEQAVRDGREVRIPITEKILNAYGQRSNQEQSLADFISVLLEQTVGG